MNYKADFILKNRTTLRFHNLKTILEFLFDLHKYLITYWGLLQ